MYKGRHLLVECRSVARELCLDDRRVLEVMARAAAMAGATVISQVRYRFGHDSPPGFTAFVLLDESHCSVHSYADCGLMALDVFTCGATDPVEVLRLIRNELDLGEVTVREIGRFAVDEASDVASLEIEKPQLVDKPQPTGCAA